MVHTLDTPPKTQTHTQACGGGGGGGGGGRGGGGNGGGCGGGDGNKSLLAGLSSLHLLPFARGSGLDRTSFRDRDPFWD